MDEVMIRLHIEALEEGGYVATSPDVPGLVAEGRTVVEATEIAQGFARKIAESCLEHGDPLPPALQGLVEPGKTIELRIPRGDPLMGRLSGFRYREVAAKLRHCGFLYDRPGPGSHEVWRHATTGRKVTLPHHPGDMAEGTLRAILRQAGIEVEAFLQA